MFCQIAIFAVLLQLASSDCIRLDQACLSGVRTIYQINNSTSYFSFYVDEVTSYYSTNSCSENSMTYQVITHRTYDTSYCLGKAESVWYKVIDTNNVKQSAIIESCGSSLKKEFVDISTLDCKVDGSDPFSSLRSTINTERYSCIKFVNKQPEISGTTRSSEKCKDEYDMGSSWHYDFMMVMFIVLGVLAVLVIVLIICVIAKPGKKNMKKQSAV